MMDIGIVNYGNGNFGSLVAALARLGITPRIWSRGQDVSPVDLVIFPGVGALPDVMKTLTEEHLLPPLTALKEQGVPFLGICLGMQLFFGEGAEGGRGLDWLPGTIPEIQAPILPHIGWNTLSWVQSPPPWLEGLGPDPAFYFVHSYRIAPDNPEMVVASTTYAELFPSMIVAPPLYGVQFHPELSGRNGHTLFKNFLAHLGPRRED